MNRPEVLILDVNETLSDLEPLRATLVGAGLPPGALEAWFAASLRDGFALSVSDGYAPFRQVASDALRTALDAAHLPDEPTVDVVLEQLAALPAHADVAPGLRRIADLGIRLVTLTNGGAGVAERLLASAGIGDRVDHYLSVETPQRWKPHPEAYRYAIETVGVEPQRVALAAVHPWDVHGARRAGLRGIWVNRKQGRYPSALLEPDLEAADFTALADRLSATS